MTVRELIDELEDMPQDAEVLLDQTVTMAGKRNAMWTKPDAVTVEFISEEVLYDSIFVRGEWLEDMEDPPEEFVILQ